MKRTVTVAIIALALAGCPKPGAPAGLKLDQPDWAASEIDQYTIVVAAETVGTHLVQVHRVDFEGVPALNLVIETMVSAGGTDSHDSAWSIVRLENLRPIRSVRSIISGGNELGADVLYSKNKATVMAMTPDGPQNAEIPIEPLDYDNDQLTTLIRALPLKTGEVVGFNVVIGIGGAKVPAEVTLVNEETVTVPAGSFPCRHLQLSVAGQDIELWYETAGLRRLVRYSAPAAGLAMELTGSVII